VIFGMLGYGSLGAAMFYMIIGNFGLHLEITETLAVSSILANDGGPAAIVAILDQVPFAAVIIAVFALIALMKTSPLISCSTCEKPWRTTRRLPQWNVYHLNERLA